MLTFSEKHIVRQYRKTKNRFGVVTSAAGSGHFRQGTCARRNNAFFALTFCRGFPRTISYLFLQTTRSSLVPGVKPTFSAILTDAMLSSSAM